MAAWPLIVLLLVSSASATFSEAKAKLDQTKAARGQFENTDPENVEFEIMIGLLERDLVSQCFRFSWPNPPCPKNPIATCEQTSISMGLISNALPKIKWHEEREKFYEISRTTYSGDRPMTLSGEVKNSYFKIKISRTSASTFHVEAKSKLPTGQVIKGKQDLDLKGKRPGTAIAIDNFMCEEKSASEAPTNLAQQMADKMSEIPKRLAPILFIFPNFPKTRSPASDR